MAHVVLQDVVLIYLVSLPVVLLFRKWRLPSTIGFLLVGSLIGPSALGLVREVSIIESIAEIGVTLLLFEVGLEFSWEELIRWKKLVLLGGVSQIGLCLLAGLGIAPLIGWSLPQGVFFGAIASLSSTVVVLDVLAEKRLLETPPGRLATGFLVLQDLAVVPLLLFLPLLGGRGGSPVTDFQRLGIGILSLTVFVGVMALVARRYLDRVLSLVTQVGGREFLIILIVAIAFGLSLLAGAAGFSPALGSFAAGLLIGGTSFNYQALSEIAPFRWTLSSLFFVSIGMLLPWAPLIQSPVYLASALAIFAAKALLISLIAGFLGFSRRTSLLIGIALGQLGEFSFLIASEGRELGILNEHLYQVFLTTTVLTLFVSPLAISMAPTLLRYLPEREGKRVLPPVTSPHKERRDHAIICGFGPLGQALTFLLKQKKIPYVIVELNPLTAHSLKEKAEDLVFGDASSPDLLRIAGVEGARLVTVTLPDFLNAVSVIRAVRSMNPNVVIITRARFRSVVADLYAAGADVVVSDELESSLEMGRQLLLNFGVTEGEVGEFMKKIHEFGSADFF